MAACVCEWACVYLLLPWLERTIDGMWLEKNKINIGRTSIFLRCIVCIESISIHFLHITYVLFMCLPNIIYIFGKNTEWKEMCNFCVWPHTAPFLLTCCFAWWYEINRHKSSFAHVPHSLTYPMTKTWNSLYVNARNHFINPNEWNAFVFLFNNSANQSMFTTKLLDYMCPISHAF